jgi:hypothetical protein
LDTDTSPPWENDPPEAFLRVNIDFRRYRRVGESLDCPHCLVTTITYQEKATGIMHDVCRSCGRAYDVHFSVVARLAREAIC